jgi:hypothetical protein
VRRGPRFSAAIQDRQRTKDAFDMHLLHTGI